MHQRTRLNLLLLTVAALLALLVWWLQPAPWPPLTPLQAEQIHSIRLLGDGRDIHLQRHHGAWRLGQTPANAARVRQLLGIAQTPSLQRFPAPPEGLQAFGLQPPQCRLWLNDLELAFGGNDPVNGWRYVMLGAQRHLIGDGFQHHLSAPPSAFLEHP